MMQVRIFRWSQRDEGDRYENQQDVQPSPPVVTIPPGERQMIRLTAVSVPRPAGESAYRIVVDEIPTRSDKAVGGSGPDRNAFGIRLQMRYSIPLFVYGGPSDDEAGSGDKHGFNLRCTLLDRPDGKRVQVTNSGTAHARLVDVAFLVNGRDMPVAEGLLGYVLPGSSMSWPVPNGATGREPPTMAAPNGGRIAIAGCSGG